MIMMMATLHVRITFFITFISINEYKSIIENALIKLPVNVCMFYLL